MVFVAMVLTFTTRIVALPEPLLDQTIKVLEFSVPEQGQPPQIWLQLDNRKPNAPRDTKVRTKILKDSIPAPTNVDPGSLFIYWVAFRDELPGPSAEINQIEVIAFETSTTVDFDYNHDGAIDRRVSMQRGEIVVDKNCKEGTVIKAALR